MAQNVIINGVTYSDVPEVDIPKAGGGTAKFFDSAGTNVAAANVLSGKSFIGPNGPDSGTMPENGAVEGEIDTKNGSVTIPAGHTNGGTVSIKASAVADLTSAALLAGKTVLGVQGQLVMPVISQDSTTKVLSIS